MIKIILIVIAILGAYGALRTGQNGYFVAYVLAYLIHMKK